MNSETDSALIYLNDLTDIFYYILNVFLSNFVCNKVQLATLFLRIE